MNFRREDIRSQLGGSLKQLWPLRTYTRNFLQLQDQLCPLIIKAVARSPQTVMRTVVHYMKKIKNLKTMTVVQWQGRSLKLNDKPSFKSSIHWLKQIASQRTTYLYFYSRRRNPFTQHCLMNYAVEKEIYSSSR